MKNRPTKKLGICMVVSAYYPEGFGGALQCRSLVQSLKEKYNFYVIATSYTPSLFKEYGEIDGVPVFRVRVWKNLAANALFSTLQILWFFLNLAPRVQVVHCHGFSRKNFIMLVMAKLTGKKILQKFTSLGMDDPLTLSRRLGGHGLMNYLKRSFVLNADFFIGISPAFSKSFTESFLKGKKYRLIPNGVDINRFKPLRGEMEKRSLRYQLGISETRRVILYTGFFSKDKGVEDLFDVWKELDQSIGGELRTLLVLIGARKSDYFEVSESVVQKIEQAIRDLGVQERVLVLDHVENIEKYYQVADLFVLPSYREGLPNVLLEAMACALPVVTSRLEGITEFLIEEKESGLAFSAGDKEGLKKQILTVLHDEDLAACLGKNARCRVEQMFDLERTAKCYEALYQEMIGCAVSPAA